MYNGSFYPEILSGSGYVISKLSAQCLLQEGLKLPYFHLEDVFVTGFAAEKCNLKRIHNIGFHPYNETRHVVKSSKDILYHYIKANENFYFFEKFVVKGINFKIVIVIFSITASFLFIIIVILCML